MNLVAFPNCCGAYVLIGMTYPVTPLIQGAYIQNANRNGYIYAEPFKTVDEIASHIMKVIAGASGMYAIFTILSSGQVAGEGGKIMLAALKKCGFEFVRHSLNATHSGSNCYTFIRIGGERAQATKHTPPAAWLELEKEEPAGAEVAPVEKKPKAKSRLKKVADTFEPIPNAPARAFPARAPRF